VSVEGAISTHIERSRAGDSDRLRALILAEPSRVDPGLCALDSSLKAGPFGLIDIIARDRAGSLVIGAVAGDTPDATLLRLIDQYSWAIDQRALLERLYSSEGVLADRPIRCLIVASSFSPSFLRRLTCLSFEVTAYLGLEVSVAGERTFVIEPAATIFGHGPEREHGLERDEDGRDADEPVPLPEPEADIVPLGPSHRAVEPSTSRVIPVLRDVIESRPEPPEFPEPSADPLDIPEGIQPAGPLETLTAEELEEFERFDRMRRQREGGPS
jgi:hypothetical protein